MKKNALLVAGCAFGIIAALHAIRFISDVPLSIGSFVLPKGLDMASVLAPLFLCILMFRSHHR